MTQITATTTTDVMTKTSKGFIALNAPKPNSVALACMAIAQIATQATQAEGLTPFGHKMGCKGGVIDLIILSGRVHSLDSFIDQLSNSGIKAVKTDRKAYPPHTFRAVLAKRVTDHVSWCASTSNQTHGGFGSRLAKVGLDSRRGELAELLNELSGLLAKQFSHDYGAIYKARNAA